MLAARVSTVLRRSVSARPSAYAAPVARKLNTRVASPSLASLASISTPTSSPLLNPTSYKSVLNDSQYEVVFQSEVPLEAFSLDNVIGGVFEEEEILDCVKRTYQPNWKRRKAKHGFLSRNATANGRKVNRRRALTGRRISI